MKPDEILLQLGCDLDAPGMDDFIELCYRVRAAWREPGENRHVMSATVQEMCDVRKTFSRAFYQRMKRAVRPVLNADDATLAEFGIRLRKRTSSELAYCLAEILEREGS